MNYEQYEQYVLDECAKLTPAKVHYSQAYTAIKNAWIGGEDITLLGFGGTITTKLRRNGDFTDTYHNVETLKTSLQSLQGTDAGVAFMNKVYEPLANGGHLVDCEAFYMSEDRKTLRLPPHMGQQVGIDKLVDGGLE
tara:strand:- start:433 stop:843 length:411 start_codon:yes stop_codon:yes gene_type:complete